MKILETHIVQALEEKIRLQEYAASVFKSISTRSGIKKAIKRQEILINGEIGKTSDWIEEHQKIELVQHEVPEKKILQLKLEVLFEDDFMAVVNKPAGYPSSGNYFRTIENALPFNLKASEKKDALPYPLPVHRLDNPTSGLLLIAKTRAAQTQLNRSFQNKKIFKAYLALVEGETPHNFIYENAIDGKAALTKGKRLKLYKKEGKFFSLLELNPETGRTHQIRKHLSENGFPIVGDIEYGSRVNFFQKKGLYLFAAGLKFQHPVSSETMEIQMELPKKFIIQDDF